MGGPQKADGGSQRHRWDGVKELPSHGRVPNKLMHVLKEFE